MSLVDAETGAPVRSHSVYVIEHPDDGIIYVGCTVDFKRRVQAHGRRPEFAGCTARVVDASIWRIDAEQKEAELIRLHQPKFNRVTPKNPSGYCRRSGFRDVITFMFGGEL